MPEGHTLHRHARLLGRHLAGQVVVCTSPQGRFLDGARRLSGQVLERTEAYGKHLFLHFAARPGRSGAGVPPDVLPGVLPDVLPDVLHVHLGLFGRLRTFHGTAPPPTAGTRLTITAAAVTVHLAGATIVDVLVAPEVAAVTGRLGPDPLRADADPAAFHAALRRRSVGIGAALLDQRAIAGIGNVYRAELLFLAGLHPDRPARTVPTAAVDALWRSARAQLRAGERSGRIVTVDPAEVGRRRRGDLRTAERLYVYGRAGRPCHRCGTRIVAWASGGRTISACPTCQPPS